MKTFARILKGLFGLVAAFLCLVFLTAFLSRLTHPALSHTRHLLPVQVLLFLVTGYTAGTLLSAFKKEADAERFAQEVRLFLGLQPQSQPEMTGVWPPSPTIVAAPAFQRDGLDG